MKQNRWKKIIGIILLMGMLILSFWYGGNAPGLQGFSVNSDVSDSKVNVESTESYKVTNDGKDIVGTGNTNTNNSAFDKENSLADDKVSSKQKTGLFGQIMMKIKKIGSSNKSRKNNPQLNKRAQKNANRAADKTIKKNKKKTAQGNKSDNNASESNNIDKTQQDTNNKDYSKTKDSTSDAKKADTDDAKAGGNEGDDDAVDNKQKDAEYNPENDSKADADRNAEDISQPGSDGTTDKSDNNDCLTCTIYISCASVLNHKDKLSDAAKRVIPDDGVILNLTTVKVKKNATVFDVLQKAARDNKVHLEYNFTPAYKTYYIEGIGNLYQFDAGNLSGWLYSVNDEFPGVGCSSCKVKDGDCIKWVYTCNFGKDVGGYVFDE